MVKADAVVTEVGEQVQTNVKSEVEAMVGMNVHASNVFVAGVALQK